MNEKIKQLADDAGINYQFAMGASADSVTDLQLEEFAEMIVAECMQIIKVDMYEDAISNMWSKNKLQMIKEHFGVAE